MTTELDKIMEKMKAQGITINVTPDRREGFEDRPAGIIAEAAKRHGMYYEKDDQ